LSRKDNIMFSKACEYGIRSAIYIAEQALENDKVSLRDVAKAIDSPEAYTSKILQLLSRNQIIISEKGPTGGYSIDRSKLEKVMLSDLVFAIDGNSVYEGCGLGLKRCNEKKPCPAHFQFKKIRNELKEMLETTTLLDLALGMKNGVSVLKR
jgi:Rrf2 family iron-sulfur cluster assembly transcriptional regulator